ncbi:carbohydrate ABC transporter permease [Falsirhodobacter halotolerans]|uniref:carbohydrate ABC transporter permease n=1 Tax=Falsirhodobacter halotolerans TaxID=1146892 RepID=UPI001FD2DDD7|nr:carbohydrate ABC transporter permease [Falsirhodobacter halotolerans]MCJ8140838.1 carbohydrate ABC transporter permease [Falsirhodobacter halotolerans]
MTATTDWHALESRGRWHRTTFLGGILAFLTLISAPVLLPYLWLVVKSLTPDNDVLGHAVLWRAAGIGALAYAGAIVIALLPERFGHRRAASLGLVAVTTLLAAILILPAVTLENYRFLWTRDVADTGSTRLDLMPSVWDAMRTSAIFAVAQVVIVVAVAAPAAYALSRFAFAARAGFLGGLLILHAFPALALTVAMFVQLHYMGLLNNLFGVILVMSALELPFAIFILKGFFDAVPWDIEMSALTDGATRFQAFRTVVLPQVRAGLIAVATFTFLRGWEEYVFVKTLLIDASHMTMSLYLFYVAQDTMGADYGLIAAVGVVYLLPVLILYLFTQKYITQMNFGGIKG